MWQGIYDVTYLASSKAKKQSDFNQLEEVPQQMWDMLEAMIRSKKNKS